MKSDRWHQITKVLRSALAETPESRETLIERACRGDRAMRAQVDALLAAHEAVGFGEPQTN